MTFTRQGAYVNSVQEELNRRTAVAQHSDSTLGELVDQTVVSFLTKCLHARYDTDPMSPG